MRKGGPLDSRRRAAGVSPEAASAGHWRLQILALDFGKEGRGKAHEVRLIRLDSIPDPVFQHGLRRIEFDRLPAAITLFSFIIELHSILFVERISILPFHGPRSMNEMAVQSQDHVVEEMGF